MFSPGVLRSAVSRVSEKGCEGQCDRLWQNSRGPVWGQHNTGRSHTLLSVKSVFQHRRKPWHHSSSYRKSGVCQQQYSLRSKANKPTPPHPEEWNPVKEKAILSILPLAWEECQPEVNLRVYKWVGIRISLSLPPRCVCLSLSFLEKLTEFHFSISQTIGLQFQLFYFLPVGDQKLLILRPFEWDHNRTDFNGKKEN